MGHRPFKQLIYPEFARIAQALASDRRLELIDLLAQAPRHVDALAEETEMSIANVSQHLQILRQAHLVESSRDGNRVLYRLCGDDVLALWLELRGVAERRLPELPQLVRRFAPPSGSGDPLTREAVLALIDEQDAVLLDVRPPVEFAHGHLKGAMSIPIDELPSRLDDLPRDRPIVAYCRGSYCLFAEEAVALLRENGLDAHQLDGGWPEWLAEGLPVVRELPGEK